MQKTLQSGTLPFQLELFAAEAPDLFPQSRKTRSRSYGTPPDASMPVRLIELNGMAVEYSFKRSKRCSIGFLVNENGLIVTAPQRITIQAVEDAIREKARWITRKLHDFSTLTNAHAKQPLKDGTQLSFLGKPIRLRIHAGQTDHIQFSDDETELRVTAATPLSAALLAKQLKTWFQAEAKVLFAKRLALFAPRMGVTYQAFALSSAKSRWGSCSVSGNIRLNWRLLHFSPELIDYVIVHELAHLHEMNHSKRFWAWVASLCPDYKARRKALRLESYNSFLF